MKLGDLIVFFPGAIMGTIAKTIKTHIPEETKKYIDENHLYHCVPRKDTINKILESGYIKPATGIFKNINSYGKSACCMFAGMPSMDSFIKNCSVNPYLNPEKIIYVVELDVNKDELNNYKIRPFSDETILYEGYCSFTNEKVKGVELVADLIRDENGNPIMDEKTGKPQGIK